MQLGLIDADLDMEEDDQLEEIMILMKSWKPMKGRDTKLPSKKLVKTGGVFMGGTTKKRTVQRRSYWPSTQVRWEIREYYPKEGSG